jgi:hypothetical protein
MIGGDLGQLGRDQTRRDAIDPDVVFGPGFTQRSRQADSAGL